MTNAETISTSPTSEIREDRRRLPAFMSENVKPIVAEWEDFARTLTPTSDGMTPLGLRDHIHQILQFVVEDIQSAQTPKEETIKSKERRPETGPRRPRKPTRRCAFRAASTSAR